KPKFVLLDEPTTGLDVLVQKEIMANLRELQRQLGFAVILITHDLGTVLEVSDRLLVLYAGELVEEQAADSMLQHAIHPYTHGLLGSYADPAADEVRISYIPGRPPDLTRPPRACPYAPRCPEVIQICREVKPELLPMWGGHARCHVAEMEWQAHARTGEERVIEEGPALVDAELSQATSHKALQLEGAEVLRLERVGKTNVRLQELKKAEE